MLRGSAKLYELKIDERKYQEIFQAGLIMLDHLRTNELTNDWLVFDKKVTSSSFGSSSPPN